MDNINEKLAAANAKKGESEAARGLSAARSFKLAADYYRKAANTEFDQGKKKEYLALAEEYDAKAGQQAVAANNSSSGGSNYSSTNSNNPTKPPVKKEEKKDESVFSNVKAVQDDLSLDEALKRLYGLVGLDGVKKRIQVLIDTAKINQIKKANNVAVPDDVSNHLVFSGNPGTGKTTVARYLAAIYKGLGVLEQGQLIETSSADLVAGYVGQTAQKTQEVVDKALGGILFVDEAYTLNAAGNTFGQEAIDTLLKAMEDHRSDLVVIVAGYSDLMKKFIDSNPGLQSRFNNYIEFQDYSGEEMMKMFGIYCKDKVLTPGAQKLLSTYFNNLYAKRDKNFGNGRTVRNVFQKITENQNSRLAHSGNVANLTREDLVTFSEEDVMPVIAVNQPEAQTYEYDRVSLEVSDGAIFNMLKENMVGQACVAFCKRLEYFLKYVCNMNGDLSEMINALRENAQMRSEIGQDGFDCFYRIRTMRNSQVHANLEPMAVAVSKDDVAKALSILRKLEKMMSGSFAD